MLLEPCLLLVSSLVGATFSFCLEFSIWSHVSFQLADLMLEPCFLLVDSSLVGAMFQLPVDLLNFPSNDSTVFVTPLLEPCFQSTSSFIEPCLLSMKFFFLGAMFSFISNVRSSVYRHMTTYFFQICFHSIDTTIVGFMFPLGGWSLGFFSIYRYIYGAVFPSN